MSELYSDSIEQRRLSEDVALRALRNNGTPTSIAAVFAVELVSRLGEVYGWTVEELYRKLKINKIKILVTDQETLKCKE